MNERVLHYVKILPIIYRRNMPILLPHVSMIDMICQSFKHDMYPSPTPSFSVPTFSIPVTCQTLSFITILPFVTPPSCQQLLYRPLLFCQIRRHSNEQPIRYLSYRRTHRVTLGTNFILIRDTNAQLTICVLPSFLQIAVSELTVPIRTRIFAATHVVVNPQLTVYLSLSSSLLFGMTTYTAYCLRTHLRSLINIVNWNTKIVPSRDIARALRLQGF